MNTVIKRIVCGFLAFLVLLVSVIIPDFSSFADGVQTLVINVDDSTHYYLYNHYDFSEWSTDDFLTSQNYTDFFNLLDGNDKTEIVNKFVDSDFTYTIRALNDFVNPDYTVNQGFNALGLYFLPIQVNGEVIPFEDCKAFIGIFSGSGSGYILLTMYLYYCPSGDDFVYSGDTMYCESPYYLTYQPFVMYTTTYNDVLHCSYSAGSAERISVTNINSNTGYYQGTANATQGCIFADFPYLFRYNTAYNSSLDTDFEVFTGYLNNNNLCVDRRTSKFNNKINGGGNVSPNDYGFLDGSFDALIYGSSFDDQGFFIAYQLNDESSTIKDQLYLKLNYQFDLDGIFSNNEFDYSDDYYNLNGIYDLYSLQDSNYINVDLDYVFSKMNTLNRTTINQYQNIYRKFNPGNGGFVASPQSVNPLNAFDILYKNGLLTSAPIAYNIDNPLIQSLGGTYKGFNFQLGVNTSALYNESGVPEISRLDTCLISVTISIYNVMTGEESSTYLYSYDYKSKTAVESGSLENGGTFGGTYNDGSQASISNPNSSELGYNIANGSQYPVSSGSNSSSTGNYVIVNDSPYPYVLVDIPENEWMNYTPNLKTLLTDFKTMLAETKDDSILKMLPETYSYFPAPFMQYMLYGIGLIIMIGIWRAITRR